MWEYIRRIYHKIFEFLHLSPFSLAGKCRAAFGTAVVLVLILALLLPYIWMGQLTKNAALEAGRAKTEMLLARHFQDKQPSGATLPALDSRGAVLDVNNTDTRWIRLTKEGKDLLATLTDEQREVVESLKSQEERSDDVLLARHKGALHSDYIKLFRATEHCISCHNPQGPSKPFGRNELIGAVIIRRPDSAMK